LKTLLVLEDESALLELLCSVLKPEYSVFKATSAEQALRFFTDHNRQIDLLLADVRLATSSGIQLALLLRMEIPGLPVILTSGYPASSWRYRDDSDLERLGANTVVVLEKPFKAEALLNAVRELLAAPRSKAGGTA
jgi:CheY-like chemotaxis protein